MTKEQGSNIKKYISLASSIYKNQKSILHYPKFVTYTVTYRCDLKCIMCDSWKKTEHSDLTLCEIENIFKQLKKVDAIRLSGGEPFVRDDMREIIKTVDKTVQPDIIHITTNGFNTQKIIDTFKDLDINAKIHIKISIDGLKKLHDKIRGIKGSYENAIATIKELKKLNKDFYIGINQTIVNASNMREYEDLKTIANELGVGLHAVVAYNDSAFYNYDVNTNIVKDNFKYETFGKFSDEELLELMKILQADANSIDDFIEKKVKQYYLKGLKNRLLNDKEEPSPKCTSTFSHLRIMPNGDIPVCLYNTELLGNLREESFEKIWFSSKNDIRRDFVKKCSGCWAGCEVIPSAIYSGNILKHLF